MTKETGVLTTSQKYQYYETAVQCFESDIEFLKDNYKKYGIHIGRSRDFSDKTIPSKEISRVHARIYKEENNFYVEDLGSSNGVYVNNNKLESFIKNTIKINDKLTLGDIELILSN